MGGWSDWEARLGVEWGRVFIFSPSENYIVLSCHAIETTPRQVAVAQLLQEPSYPSSVSVVTVATAGWMMSAATCRALSPALGKAQREPRNACVPLAGGEATSSCLLGSSHP